MVFPRGCEKTLPFHHYSIHYGVVCNFAEPHSIRYCVLSCHDLVVARAAIGFRVPGGVAGRVFGVAGRVSFYFASSFSESLVGFWSRW